MLTRDKITAAVLAVSLTATNACLISGGGGGGQEDFYWRGTYCNKGLGTRVFDGSGKNCPRTRETTEFVPAIAVPGQPEATGMGSFGVTTGGEPVYGPSIGIPGSPSIELIASRVLWELQPESCTIRK